MSEPPPPPFPASAPVGGQAALTPEAIEAVLADFRGWLQQLTGPVAFPAEPAEPVDLRTLLAQFTALRHEVNLQTRATRSQQEQAAQAMQHVGQALAALDRARQSATDDTEERLRPLLKTLVDLYDSLVLTGRELKRIRAGIVEALDGVTFDSVEPLAAAIAELTRVDDRLKSDQKRSLWARLTGSGPDAAAQAAPLLAEQIERLRKVHARQDALREQVEAVQQLFDSLGTGFAMCLQRVERGLEQHGLEPIAAVGEAFDPEQMEVMEVVADSDRASGEVVEEVRRGYLWRGRVFRYALVRVARS